MIGSENEPSHPKLLEDLTASLIEHEFDLKFLIKAIVGSRAYQLSSRQTEPGQDDPTLFARMPLRGLSGEQLFDSIAQATGYRAGMTNQRFRGVGSIRQQFLTRFANDTDKRSETQTSILQALAMMNGQLTATATSLTRSETLAGVLASPFMDTRDRIETLTLATLSRKPTKNEMNRFTHFVKKRMETVQSNGQTKAEKEALADIFWVLLNGSEFRFNH